MNDLYIVGTHQLMLLVISRDNEDDIYKRVVINALPSLQFGWFINKNTCKGLP